MHLRGKAALQFGTAGHTMREGSRRFPFWRALTAIVLGVMLARWTWILFAPHAISVMPAAAQDVSPAAEDLFGATAASGENRQSVLLPNVRLTGIFAGSPGFAILELDGNKQLGVVLGGEVARGVRLGEIAPDHVMLESGGAQQRVELEQAGTAKPAEPVPGMSALQQQRMLRGVRIGR